MSGRRWPWPARHAKRGRRPAARTTPARCACGHTAAAHEHYRPGTDCGSCGPAICRALRPA